MSETLNKKLAWRLRVMMAERDIRSATELHRLLLKSGYNITSSQLTRIVKERPERISTDLLDHLLNILNCEISDLLRSESASSDVVIKESASSNSASPNANTNTPQPKKPRIRKEPITTGQINASITGPKLTAIPFTPRKK